MYPKYNTDAPLAIVSSIVFIYFRIQSDKYTLFVSLSKSFTLVTLTISRGFLYYNISLAYPIKL